MRATLLILVMLGSTAAHGQPGQTAPAPEGAPMAPQPDGAPPQPYYPPQQPYYPPQQPYYPPQQPYYPPPQPYYPPQPQVVQLQLTEQQHLLLEQGEISIGRYVTGGILSYVAGFGIGHAVQGRWSERGWIFTFGEVASFGAMLYGVAQCCQHQRGENYILAGALMLAAFRVWGVVDAWVVPPHHNKQVRALRRSLGLSPPPSRYGLYLAPPQTPNGSGGVAGLSLSF